MLFDYLLCTVRYLFKSCPIQLVGVEIKQISFELGESSNVASAKWPNTHLAHWMHVITVKNINTTLINFKYKKTR